MGGFGRPNPKYWADIMVAARIQTEINIPVTALNRNITTNSRSSHQWLDKNEHRIFSGAVAIIGGAPSMKQKLDEIRHLREDGVMIWSVNGSHDFLVDNGIVPDFFCMLDARPLNKFAEKPQKDCVYLIASQCHPKVFKHLADSHVLLWHCEHDDFPRKDVSDIINKKKRNPFYTTVAAKKTVGLTSLPLAYTLGFDEVYIYGMDSSFDDYQHSYKQKQNEKDDIITATVANIDYKTTPTLCAQAHLYAQTRNMLEEYGITIHMKSEGLMKAMHDLKDGMTLEEKEATKYQDMWDVDGYRSYSPGLQSVPYALMKMHPDEGCRIVDFGVGSGKAAWALMDAGYKVLGVDIAANCLDANKPVPLCISCLWDIPDSVVGDYGYCTDVMEHIPTERVVDVFKNIKKCIKKKTFYQIDLQHDGFGAVIGDVLHLTVKPPEWWIERLEEVYSVEHFDVKGNTLRAIVS